jgi:hypothetical protein
MVEGLFSEPVKPRPTKNIWEMVSSRRRWIQCAINECLCEADGKQVQENEQARLRRKC